MLEKKNVNGVGLSRLKNAFLCSMAGFRYAVTQESAFRQELLLVIPLLPLAFWVGDTTMERVVLISSLLLVLIVEIINSAVEAAIDRIGPEIHPLSRNAKDLGSAAVLLALANALVVWLLIVLY